MYGYGDKQDVEINVSNNLETTDSDQATSLVVEHECYKGMSKSDKRVLNQILKEEIDDKKEIIFLGKHSTLDPMVLSANLDLEIAATVEDLSTDSNVFAISFGKDIYDNDVLSFYRADCEVNSEEALNLLAETITCSFENFNDEERLESWPTTTVGSGSQGFSFGTDVGCSGANASAGYTYAVNLSDITCMTQLVDGDINDYHWTFSYANGSNVSKYSSALELGSRYNNRKGKFTLYTESYVLSRQSGEGGTVYRIALEDISTAK